MPTRGLHTGNTATEGVTQLTKASFNSADWILRVSHAASEVAAAQESHQDELHELLQQRSLRNSDSLTPNAPFHPSEILRSLYRQAFSGKGRHDARTCRYNKHHYDSLREALAAACRVLASHPTLGPFVDPAQPMAEFGVRMGNRGGKANMPDLIAGIVSYAAELHEQGLRQPATQLNELLDMQDDRPAALEFDNVSSGIHVALLHGLEVQEVIPSGNDMAIAPFKSLEMFVDRSVVRMAAPEVENYRRWESVAAIIKPFRWKPHFHEIFDDPEFEPPWGDAFSEDAAALTELLALFHASPVIPVATVHYCTHPAASHLLGQSHFHGSYTWGPSVQYLDMHTESCLLSPKALNAAKRHLQHRDSERFRICEPVIARLAEALARGGRFQVDDKILDVAIALEQLYQPEGEAISFKLRARAACFLESRADRRLRTFGDVKELYDARSAIVHRRKKGISAESKTAAFEKGFDVARRTIVKFLQIGPPSDWDEVVVGCIDSHRRDFHTSAATTEVGYTNRNDQTVIRRTDIPGNDHNQRVYVLECNQCYHRYGANGSDIWQRRCPNCGGGKPGLSFDTLEANSD